MRAGRSARPRRPALSERTAQPLHQQAKAPGSNPVADLLPERCHGLAGRGEGPAAASLCAPPMTLDLEGVKRHLIEVLAGYLEALQTERQL